MKTWEELANYRSEHELQHTSALKTGKLTTDFSCNKCYQKTVKGSENLQNFIGYIEAIYGKFTYNNSIIRRFDDLKSATEGYYKTPTSALGNEAFTAAEELVERIRLENIPSVSTDDLAYLIVNITHKTRTFSKGQDINQAHQEAIGLLKDRRAKELKEQIDQSIKGKTEDNEKAESVTGFSSRNSTPEPNVNLTIEDISPDKIGTLPLYNTNNNMQEHIVINPKTILQGNIYDGGDGYI